MDLKLQIFSPDRRENKRRVTEKTKVSALKNILLTSAVVICISVPSAEASASRAIPSELIPSGIIVGISVKSDGVVVVSLGEVETADGKTSPAADAGILSGDIIKSIGEEKIVSIDDIKTSVRSSGGREISVRIERSGKSLRLSVTPALNLSGSYELGVWLRDGLAGMGTVTFVDPKSGVLGVLGHPINDADAKVMLPLKSGMLMGASVGSIIKGRSGTPGQLQGNLDFETKLGTIHSNTDCGIFGVTESAELIRGKTMPVGPRKNIRVGEAFIISNISGEIERYSIEISRVFSGSDERNMLITVTDERLISQTGGIVQGMSGSPIIQDGKLIGAVTHVLVNEPVKGYGISVEKMLEKAFYEEKQTAA